MIGPGPVSGHPDDVWSKSVKACGQETVFCWCAKKERRRTRRRQKTAAAVKKNINTQRLYFTHKA